MIEIGDEITLPNGISAKVVGWQKMIGQSTEWCLKWWEDEGPMEYWANLSEIESWSDSVDVR